MASLQRPNVPGTLDSDNLRSLYAWLDAVPLSRPKRNIAEDFSDGVMMAEVLAYFVPRLVDLSFYPTANINDDDAKTANWRNLNQNVFASLDIRLSDYTISQLVGCKPGIIEQVLWELRRKLLDSVQIYTKSIDINNPPLGYSLRDISGFNEISRDRSVWKALVAEFLGTLILVFVSCGSCLSWGKPAELDKNGKEVKGSTETEQPSTVQISLASGIIVATMTQAIGHISGGHINPAVTIGQLVATRIRPIRAILYIIVQIIGGIAGAALLKALTPGDSENLGLTVPNGEVAVAQAFGVEFVATLVIVLTFFSVMDENRNDVKGSAYLAIGLAVTACHLATFKYTGSSMNPARTFGPAVIAGVWTDHWVYWMGPIVGGAVAGLLYSNAFRAPKFQQQQNNHFYDPTQQQIPGVIQGTIPVVTKLGP